MKRSTKLCFKYISEFEKKFQILWQIYSTPDNETPPISRVMIRRHLIFCWLTSPPCCKSHQKCTPFKYKKRQKAGFLIVTQTPSKVLFANSWQKSYGTVFTIIVLWSQCLSCFAKLTRWPETRALVEKLLLLRGGLCF